MAVHRTVSLPRAKEASRIARAALDACETDLDDRQLRDGRLLVTELASNAILHGRGEVTLDIHIEDGDLCVAVEDQGTEQPRIRQPDSSGGYGLRLVDALADEWGNEKGSSHVWFILRRGDPEARPSDGETS